jgi:hypothetical protein
MNQRLHNQKKTESLIAAARARNKFIGPVNARVTNGTPCFGGYITALQKVNLEYNPSYPLHRTRYAPELAFSAAFDAITEHEMIHKGDGKGRGCPKNEQLDISEVLTPIAQVLKSKGFPNVPFGSQGHTLYTYFANLYEDLVDNTIVCDNLGARGLCLMYDDMAQHAGEIGSLFEAFHRVQAVVFPKKEGVASLVKHFEPSAKSKEVAKAFLTRTGLAAVPLEQRITLLSDSRNWKAHSTIFADEFSKLLDPQQLRVFCFPLIGGNDFARLGNEDVQMEIALKAYGERGSTFVPPAFMEDNLALLSVYRALAKKIDMKVQSHSVETQRPVAHVARRSFDFGKDQLERLEFGLNNCGNLEAQTGKYPVIVRSRYQVSPGSFPEVRVGLLDCSGSMRLSVTGEEGKIMNPWAKKEKQWTDTSRYHHSLLVEFGLCELFRRRGTLKESNVRLGVYSDTTRMGNNLGESERLALAPAFGGTEFSKNALDAIFKGNGALVYTISDGEIENWSGMKDVFIEGARRHYYVHLQIGNESQMYNDLKSAGLYVVRDDGRNAAKILIDLTQKTLNGVK